MSADSTFVDTAPQANVLSTCKSVIILLRTISNSVSFVARFSHPLGAELVQPSLNRRSHGSIYYRGTRAQRPHAQISRTETLEACWKEWDTNSPMLDKRTKSRLEVILLSTMLGGASLPCDVQYLYHL